MVKGLKFSNASARKASINLARRRYNDAARKVASYVSSSTSEVERDLYSRAERQLRDRAASLRGINTRKRLDADIMAIAKDSENYLPGLMRDDWMRGELLGQLRLSGTTAGHRFYALTKSLWIGEKPKNRINAIRRKVVKANSKNLDFLRKYGKKPNVSQLIEIIEDATGVKIGMDDSSITETDRTLFLIAKKAVIKNYG